jgi:hypothetical protein
MPQDDQEDHQGSRAASLPPSSERTTAKREFCWNDRDEGKGQGRDQLSMFGTVTMKWMSHMILPDAVWTGW